MVLRITMRECLQPVQSAYRADMGRRHDRRTIFTGGDSLAQQSSDFPASDIACAPSVAERIAYCVRICRQYFLFQGIQQRH